MVGSELLKILEERDFPISELVLLSSERSEGKIIQWKGDEIVTKKATKAATPAATKKILLVDDDAEIIESMRTILEAKGHSVLVACDGSQGIAVAERENPDLVVLDMMMPKRSGFLVLEKLRREYNHPIRIIMVTANEGNRHRAYAEMLGVDDYIRKPFAMDRLLESVEKLLA